MLEDSSAPIEAKTLHRWRPVLAAGAMILALAGCSKSTIINAEGTHTDTAVENVLPGSEELPASTVPDVTPTTTPAENTPVQPPTTLAQPTAPKQETVKPTETLSAREKRYLSEISGFKGLESAELKQMHVFSTEFSDVTILSADSAPLPAHITIDEIERYVRAAEQISSLSQSHTVNMQLGKGSAVDVPFTVTSNLTERQKAKGDRLKQTLVISGGSISNLAGKPLAGNAACSSAVNVNTQGGPHTVSLIGDMGKQVEYGQYAQKHCVATEVFNAHLDAHLDAEFLKWLRTTNPDVSNLTHPSVPNPNNAQVIQLLQLYASDIAAISHARAFVSAQGGNSYPVYISMAKGWGYLGLPGLGAKLIIVDEVTYKQMFALA